MNTPTAAMPLKAEPHHGYRVDDQDARPWGHYIVTAVGKTPRGEEYCEKQIVIKPWNILSLQSHELRRETWTVRKGTLTALVDGCRIDAVAGETIDVPARAVHCMANLSDEACIVHERQEGICREEDIRRYVDAYNRTTENSPLAASSVALYGQMLVEIGKERDAH